MEIRFTSKDIGTHLDGAHGWHNNYAVVDLAMEHGMELDAEERADLEAYRKDQGHGSHNPDGVPGALLNQGGLVDKATNFLESVTEDGLSWEWDAGELSLAPVAHTWEYHGAIRECSECKLRETYWDDEEYPVDPCPGADDDED